MTPLPLTPLPAVRADDTRCSWKTEMEGFVDDQAVLAMLNAPPAGRSQAYPPDLVLSANDDDFAGWPVSVVASPFRVIAEASPGPPAPLPTAPVRRPLPPRWEDEAGIGAAHRGNHRRWLTGAAGVVTSLLLTCLLLTLARHDVVPLDSGIFEKAPSAAANPGIRIEVPVEGSAVARLTP